MGKGTKDPSGTDPSSLCQFCSPSQMIDLPCTMTASLPYSKTTTPQSHSGAGQMTASNGNMHDFLILELVKPHEDRLNTVVHGRCRVLNAVRGGDLTMPARCHWRRGRRQLPSSASSEPEGVVVGPNRLGFRFQVGLIRPMVVEKLTSPHYDHHWCVILCSSTISERLTWPLDATIVSRVALWQYLFGLSVWSLSNLSSRERAWT